MLSRDRILPPVKPSACELTPQKSKNGCSSDDIGAQPFLVAACWPEKRSQQASYDNAQFDSTSSDIQSWDQDSNQPIGKGKTIRQVHTPHDHR